MTAVTRSAIYDHTIIEYDNTYELAADVRIDNTPAREYRRAYDFYESKLAVDPNFKPRAPRTSIVPPFIDNFKHTRWIKAVRKSDGKPYWIARRTTSIKTFKLEVETLGFDVALARAEVRSNIWLVQRDQQETSFAIGEFCTEDVCKTFASVRDEQGRVFFASEQKARQLSRAYNFTLNRD